MAWDSTGQPVLLSDEALASPTGGEIVIAAFRSGGVTGHHIRVRADSARLVAALAAGDPARARVLGMMGAPVIRDLTPDEGAQARASAAWLWARRCPTSLRNPG